MRWKADKRPAHGEQRTRTPFAIFPERMSDGVTVVWLERYAVVEEYYCGYAGVSWDLVEAKPI